MARAYDEEDHPFSERGIEQRNQGLLRRYHEFRRSADAVAAAWRAHPEVLAHSSVVPITDSTLFDHRSERSDVGV